MNDAKNDGVDEGAENTSHEAKMFDFSSDLNIKPIRDDSGRTDAVHKLPKSVSDEVLRSLSEQMKPKAPPSRLVQQAPPPTRPSPSIPPVKPAQPVAPVTPFAPPVPKSPPPTTPINPFKASADPFREPINDADMAWPFASPETLAKSRASSKPTPTPSPAAPFKLGPTSSPTPTSSSGTTQPPRPPLQPIVPAPATVPTTPVAPTMPATASTFQRAPILQPLQKQTLPQTSAQNALRKLFEPSTLPSSSAPQNKPPSNVQNIRTYENDIAQVLAQRGTSKTSMAIAESKKKGEGETIRAITTPSPYEESSHTGFKITIVILCLILVGAGIFGGYYFYSRSPVASKTEPVAKPRAIASLVPSDFQTILAIDGINSVTLLARIKNEIDKAQPFNTIKEIIPTEIKDGQTYRVSAPEMPTTLDVPIPDIIYRTLTPSWMLGVHSNGLGERSVFVVVTTNLFQNAFSGMLTWEEALPAELRKFLARSADEKDPPILKGQFKDQIVKNKDVRAFVTTNGETRLVYSFIDNSTLIFAQNNEVLGAIITRLENKAFVR